MAKFWFVASCERCGSKAPSLGPARRCAASVWSGVRVLLVREPLLQLVEVLRVFVTGERVRSVGTQHFYARDDKGPHVPDPRRGVGEKLGGVGSQIARHWRVQGTVAARNARH